jgi:hypothetical protein
MRNGKFPRRPDYTFESISGGEIAQFGAKLPCRQSDILLRAESFRIDETFNCFFFAMLRVTAMLRDVGRRKILRQM